jgi:hypothetical protein
MEMMLRARILAFGLGLCSILNFGLLVYPDIVLGPKSMHAIFLAYALPGYFLFRWILKVGEKDPSRGDKLFVRCIFAYWGIPVLLGYVFMFLVRSR